MVNCTCAACAGISLITLHGHHMRRQLADNDGALLVQVSSDSILGGWQSRSISLSSSSVRSAGSCTRHYGSCAYDGSCHGVADLDLCMAIVQMLASLVEQRI